MWSSPSHALVSSTSDAGQVSAVNPAGSGIIGDFGDGNSSNQQLRAVELCGYL